MTTAINFDEALVLFGGSAPSVDKPDKAILGGKGLGLQEMSRIGVDVPPGFTLITPLCQVYDKENDLPQEMWDKVKAAIQSVEKDTGKKFGANENPLLFSCRSGAAISMPGMMDTVLNIVSSFFVRRVFDKFSAPVNLTNCFPLSLYCYYSTIQGLNATTVEALAKASNSPRFAYDAYRRLLDMFGDVVLGMPHEAFEAKMDQLKAKTGVGADVEFTADHLKELVEMYKEVYKEKNMSFPEDPYDQLRACIKAVFGSWNSERAIKYREIKDITGLIGTACNIQTMVFGNLGDTSGTGVAFSRDPGTGKNVMMGEYLINAQGEDVVSGIRTPEPISKMKEVLPEAYDQFMKNVSLLEKHFGDMQDVEFTVEHRKLWMLQCRSGKRTGQAAFNIAVDMVNEGLCTKEEALLKIETDHVKQILHPSFAKEALGSAKYMDNIVAVGLAGGPGAAVGKLVFTNTDAEARSTEKIIMVREVTSPEDVGGMWASQGILTARGGITSRK
jgi:pyruvate,orthophosphate dikinase